MLHKDVLIRLCEARELLRETAADRRSVRQVAREIPAEPIPGCFSLMCNTANQIRNFEKRPNQALTTLPDRRQL
jgi:hypothetical protein